MAEVRIELRQVIEVGFRGDDVAALVRHFAEKVMRITDLARIGGQFQAGLVSCLIPTTQAAGTSM